MSESFLTRIINLLNRAKSDGLTFDALTFHMYNSEQDFFDKKPEMRTVAAKVRNILDAYNTHIICDEQGAYHLKKGIPHQLSFNFEAQNEQTEPEILITEGTIEDDSTQQLLFDFFEEDTNIPLNTTSTTSPYPFPTLFDNDPDFY